MMFNNMWKMVAGQPNPAPSPIAAVGCPVATPGQPDSGVAKAMCNVGGWGGAIVGAPASAWHWATQHWLRLVLFAVLGVLVGVAGYVWRRWLWRRAVGRGTWVEVVPPRQTSLRQSAAVWRLLSSLAGRADSGFHLVHPPLALEVHGDGRGRLALTMWVPKWVTTASVTTEARRAWPGAHVRPFVPPMGGADWKTAGFAMAVRSGGTDHEPLVDDLDLHGSRSGSMTADGDPLRAVFESLREAGGPTVLQVLAKPATSKRVNKLAGAAQHPVKPRKPFGIKVLDGVSSVLNGAFREVLDFITPGPSTPSRSRHTGEYQPPNEMQRYAMRQAADKLRSGPHLLVAIRAVALRPTRGWASTDASSMANGYRVAAYGLRPKRLWWARAAVSDRYAHRGEWLLTNAAELGVLFHLPADPARFGFQIAAANRPFPYDAAKIRPEKPSERDAGWSRGRWSVPPGTTTTALAMRDDDGEDDTFDGRAAHFSDDELDTDWDDN